MKELQQYVIGFIILISCLLPAVNAPAADEDKIAGVLTAGETGYEIPVEVVNNNREPMQDVTVAIENYPAGLVNVQVSSRPDSPISPGKSFVFLVSFDVAEDAKANDKAEILLSVTAQGVVFDNPSPQLTVTIEEKTKESAPVLKLITVDRPEPGQQRPGYSQNFMVEYEEGTAGFSAYSNDPHYDLDWTGAMNLTRIPLEITLGQPFEFEVEVKKRIIYESRDTCFRKEGGEIYRAVDYATGYDDPTRLSPKIKRTTVPAFEVSALHDLHAYCYPAADKVDAVVEKDGHVKLKEIYTPVKTEEPNGNDSPNRNYHYKVQYQTNGKIINAQEKRVITIERKTDARGNLHSDEKKSSSKYHSPLAVTYSWSGAGFLSLYYDMVHEGDYHIATLSEFDWPDELKRPPRDERGQPAETAIASGSDQNSDDNQDSDGEGDIETDTGISGPDTNPIDPGSIDPNNPEVAVHIRQWIALAEPPENTVPGNTWRYDRFGRMVGNGSGVQTRQSGTHETVAYGSGTPEEKVWSLRKELDSINHCTLEEYVVAQLSSESIQHCLGRYDAVRDLKGTRLAEAKSILADKGFRYSLAPGTPAKSQRESGAVEKQEPGPEQHLKKGATVTLYVHSQYVPQAPSLPDFTGRSLQHAKVWLADNGLSATLKPGDPAPKAAFSGAVQQQDPKPGTMLKTGERVSLTVYSKYVDIRKVPDVSGLTIDEARQRLAEAGLDIEAQETGRPPTRNLARTAKKQNPRPATDVAPGQKVKVWFYGRYVQTREEQVAAHDCSSVERSRAYWDDDANAPRCGCFDGLKLNRNRTSCVAERIANTELCSDTFPGSIARGYTDAGKINCTCPSGLKWNSDRTKCLEEDIVNNEICKREFPGSIARGYTDTGKIDCICPSGLKWNSGRTKCLAEDFVNNEMCKRDFPGSIARGYTDAGKVNCICPSGLKWNDSGSRCIDEAIVNNTICARDFPGSIARGYTSAGKINCICPSRHVWNVSGTGCVRQKEERNCTLRDLSEAGGLCHDYSQWRKGQMADTLVNVIVVNAEKVRSGWKPPAGYLHGRLQDCSVLLKEAREKCVP